MAAFIQGYIVPSIVHSSLNIGTGLNTTDVNQVINAERNQLYLILGIIAIICLIICFFVSRAISHGLNRINKALKNISTGDLTYNVRINSSDEVGDMARRLP